MTPQLGLDFAQAPPTLAPMPTPAKPKRTPQRTTGSPMTYRGQFREYHARVTARGQKLLTFRAWFKCMARYKWLDN